jgi:hypothetical protein
MRVTASSTTGTHMFSPSDPMVSMPWSARTLQKATPRRGVLSPSAVGRGPGLLVHEQVEHDTLEEAAAPALTKLSEAPDRSHHIVRASHRR